MIIDAHCHVWDKEYLSDELRGILIATAEKHKFDLSLILNATPERLVKEMDEAGIDKAVILALDYEYLYRGHISYKEYNDKVAGYVKDFPDRLIGLAGIDPRRGKEAIQELERCIGKLGFAGIKLWPLMGFYPDDPKFYPFYERVEELGAVILCHTGAGPQKTYLKYCRPAFVDTVAIDFPKIKIIMAHMGEPWTNEAMTVAAKNPNVYIDISAWEAIFKYAPFAFYQTLVQAKMNCGIDKILFGSDWPLLSPILSLERWVKGIKKMELPSLLKSMGYPEFNEEEKNKILGGNAAKIFDL